MNGVRIKCSIWSWVPIKYTVQKVQCFITHPNHDLHGKTNIQGMQFAWEYLKMKCVICVI